jgi:hypothetical protein
MILLIGGAFLIADLVMEIVPFEIAKKLEEKGFQIEFKYALGYYDTRGQFMTAADHWFLEYWTIAPTISQVLKWLREKKKMHIMINFWPAGYSAEIFTEIGKDKDSFCWERYIDECDYYDSYELAVLAGVEYCLDNLI